ncbi:P27 family phage terminase small subunit [Aeromonas sp.]|uniref:P27 family phage terminase small subunit n=1 Tax=Aeromonas sp. TaxID=647 RepID=UPI0025866F75|nr:P27 family phage terminase small subunit [Aeromonas sp.]MCX7128068.1 P27 family phage terminase small subunit [Aeromonas sp.]
MAINNNNKPPRLMLKTKESKDFYQALQHSLANSDLFNPEQDQLLLSLMAEQYQIYKLALNEVQLNGAWFTQIGDKNQERVVKAPAMTVVAEQAKFLRECLKELALTPRARAAIKIEQQQANSTELEHLTKLMQKGGLDD